MKRTETQRRSVSCSDTLQTSHTAQNTLKNTLKCEYNAHTQHKTQTHAGYTYGY